jgi:hypothetical protein
MYAIADCYSVDSIPDVSAVAFSNQKDAGRDIWFLISSLMDTMTSERVQEEISQAEAVQVGPDLRSAVLEEIL